MVSAVSIQGLHRVVDGRIYVAAWDARAVEDGNASLDDGGAAVLFVTRA
jgi:hypothetical protein